MKTDHPILAVIRAGIDANGAHSHHWGELRREVFPGLAAWGDLKAWCLANGYECDLAFSQSSRDTEVQFRKARKNAPAPVAAAEPVVAPVDAAMTATASPPTL
jgi:hypothetical protein